MYIESCHQAVASRLKYDGSIELNWLCQTFRACTLRMWTRSRYSQASQTVRAERTSSSGEVHMLSVYAWPGNVWRLVSGKGDRLNADNWQCR